MNFGERIQLRLNALGMKQAQLARAVGISPQAVGKMIAGNTSNTAHIYQIAKALQTTPEYLVGESDDPGQSQVSEDRRGYASVPADLGGNDDDLVTVHEIDLTFGMGATYLDVPVTKKVRRFDREWLRDYTGSNPDRLFFCEGIGNSMAPYIESHDLLMIDTGQDTVRLSEQVWAIAYGNCGAIKRLFPMADGSIKMCSDNPSVPDEVAYDGELHVIGRVVAIIRKT